MIWVGDLRLYADSSGTGRTRLAIEGIWRRTLMAVGYGRDSCEEGLLSFRASFQLPP